MLRVLLTVLLPLLAPFLAYFGWVWLRNRRAANASKTAEEVWDEAPWIWLAAVSLVCALMVMSYFYITGGHAPGTRLAPPTLVDGKVVPSHPVE